METKLNKFAQLYKSHVIYILETPLSMGELKNYFDPETVWVDITDMPNIEVGYIQGVDESGNFVLKPPTSVSQEEDYMTSEEIYYTILYNINLQREKYMNKILRKKSFLDISYALRFYLLEDNNDPKKIVAKEIMDYIIETNEKIEAYLKEKNYSDQTIIAEYLSKPFDEIITEVNLTEFSI